MDAAPRPEVPYLMDFAGTNSCVPAAEDNPPGFGSDRSSRKSSILVSSELIDCTPILTASDCVGDVQHVIIPSIIEFCVSTVRRSNRAKEHVLTSGVQQIKWCYLPCR